MSEKTEERTVGSSNTRSQTIALKLYASSVKFGPDAGVKSLIKSGTGTGAFSFFPMNRNSTEQP